MNKTTLCGLALVTLFAGGCWQKSLHPFYTAQDLAPDAKLVGTWKDAEQADDKKDRWIFKQGAGKGYELEIRDEEDKPYRYSAHLFKIEQGRFLDLLARDRQISAIPAHHLFRIDEIGGTLKMAPLNIEWIADWLKKNPQSLPHMRVPDPDSPDDRDKDDFILMAETKALQKFLREHLKDPKLFGDADDLKRVAD